MKESVAVVVVSICIFWFVCGVEGGCGGSLPGGYSIGASNGFNITTPGDGRVRTYWVYIPPSYNTSYSAPVVFLLHGGFGTGKNAETAYGMDAVADQNNFIVVRK